MTYQEFIDNILQTRGRFGITEGYKERHHIQPKCMGGTDDEENLIDLYPQEHYEAHKLLALENPDNKLLQYAWWAMSNKDGIKISSDDYEQVKIIISNQMKIRMKEAKENGTNTLGNLKEVMQTEEYKQKKRENAYKSGFNKANEGKKFSDEHKQKIGQANKGKVISQDSRGKILNSLKEYFANNPISDETRKKLSEKSSGENNPAFGTKMYNNGIKNKRFIPGTEPEGWIQGELPRRPYRKKEVA